MVRMLAGLFILVPLILLPTSLPGGLISEAASLTYGVAARLTPPHNERVSRSGAVKSQVTRYELAADLHLEISWAHWNFTLFSLGVQDWKKVTASGLAAWEASDWTVNNWRVEWESDIFIPLKTQWFGLTANFGHCRWCSVPDGRNYFSVGLRMEHKIGDNK